MAKDGSEWLGTLPAWFTVVIAFLALIAASASAFFSYRNTRNQHKQLEYQQAQLDRLEDDKRREQASKIAAWVYTAIDSVESGLRGARPIQIRSRYIRIANRSDLPIYVVAVQAFVKALSPEGPRIALDVMPPGVLDIPLEDPPEGAEEGTFASIAFLDGNGSYWVRKTVGGIEEIDDEKHEVLTNGSIYRNVIHR